MNFTILTIFVFLFFSAEALTDPFEGKVVYKHTYYRNNDRLPLLDKSENYGNQSEFYFKNGNYKQIVNGGVIEFSIYNRRENRCYTLLNNPDTVYVKDCSQASENIRKFKIAKNQEEILGVKCELLTIETDRRKAFYYYSDQFKVDPSLLSGHKYGSISLIYSKTEAIPLKIINEYKDFTIVMTAKDIKRMSVPDSIFSVDENLIRKMY